MIKYSDLGWQLRTARRRVGLAATYRELVGPLPLEPGQGLFELRAAELARGVLEVVKFPVYDGLMWEYEHGDGDDQGLLSYPMAHLVAFCGLDADNWFEEWEEPFRLVLALWEAGEPDYPIPNAYEQEARAWWTEQMERYDLPPLAVLEREQIRDRVRNLPAPWNGLWAMWRWAEGDTGYLFADIPANYVYDMDMDDFDWSPEAVQQLEKDWREAEAEIFEPAWELMDLCRRNEEAMEICIKLAVGYPVSWIVRDGEVMVMDYE